MSHRTISSIELVFFFPHNANKISGDVEPLSSYCLLNGNKAQEFLWHHDGVCGVADGSPALSRGEGIEVKNPAGHQ